MQQVLEAVGTEGTSSSAVGCSVCFVPVCSRSGSGVHEPGSVVTGLSPAVAPPHMLTVGALQEPAFPQPWQLVHAGAMSGFSPALSRELGRWDQGAAKLLLCWAGEGWPGCSS